MNLTSPDGNSAIHIRKAFLTLVSKVSDLLASVKLALALLITVLACCVTGVTILRGQRSWELIFNTLWFNGILVLLVVNVVFCFFRRIWGRKITLVSLGMILFHLSFVAILLGVVYNSMFCFRGTIRLTEGETLPSGDPQSYDLFEHGRYFSFEKLRGETTLIAMHRGYVVENVDKRAAYEIAVGVRGRQKQGILYITHSFDHDGFSYINDREGYSLLIMLYDRIGKELYGGHVPLQSLKQKDETYLYTTGTRDGPRSLLFPQDPLRPLLELQIVYIPSPINDRAGEAVFNVWPLATAETSHDQMLLADEKARIGERVTVRDHFLSATEVRYWVAMTVRYEPGKPIVLASLWLGLGGMIITFIGRMRKGGV